MRCHFFQLNLTTPDLGDYVGKEVLSRGFAVETAYDMGQLKARDM